MGDLASKPLIVAKGLLFLGLSAVTAALILLESPSTRVAILLAVLLNARSFEILFAWMGTALRVLYVGLPRLDASRAHRQEPPGVSVTPVVYPSRSKGATPMSNRTFPALVAVLALSSGAHAQNAFLSSDAYTRYELLAPETHQFKIYYEVTETTVGSPYHFNPIRKGSEASDESVLDGATGKPLRFEVVTGAQGNAELKPARLDPEGQYIKVHLPRPVPEGGETRLVIIKTYKDAATYYTEGDLIVWKRSLGNSRNSVVLPPGYEIVSSAAAAQVMTLPDGRLKLAFMNGGSGGALEVLIKARRIAGAGPTSGGVR